MTVTQSQSRIDHITVEFFRCVSFAPGDRPNYAGIRELFIPTGLLIKGTPLGTEITSLDEFIEPRQKSFDDGALTEFRETELSATTTIFGHAAARESVYEKVGVAGGVAFASQGVIFTQFVWQTTSGWLMSAMAWDDERDGLAIANRTTSHSE
jgi:hypothetical protein